jgi:hypothetical protein
MSGANLSEMSVEALMDLRKRVDQVLFERRAELEKQLERMAVVGGQRVVRGGRSPLRRHSLLAWYALSSLAGPALSQRNLARLCTARSKLPLFGGPRLLAVGISGLIPAARGSTPDVSAKSRHIEFRFRFSPDQPSALIVVLYPWRSGVGRPDIARREVAQTESTPVGVDAVVEADARRAIQAR